MESPGARGSDGDRPSRAPGPGRSCSPTLPWSWPFPFPAANVIPQGGAGPCASVMSLRLLLTESRLGLQGPQGCAPSLPPPSGTFHVTLGPGPRTSQSSRPAPPGMELEGGGPRLDSVVVRGLHEQRLMLGRAWAQGTQSEGLVSSDLGPSLGHDMPFLSQGSPPDGLGQRQVAWAPGRSSGNYLGS